MHPQALEKLSIPGKLTKLTVRDGCKNLIVNVCQWIHVYILAPKKDQSRLTPIWLEEEDIQMLPMEVRDAHQKGETVWDLRYFRDLEVVDSRKPNWTYDTERKLTQASVC